MRCSEVQQKLDLFGTQELEFSVRERIEVHLKSCAGCRKALVRIRRFEDLFTTTPVPPVPNGFAIRVVARAKEQQATVTRLNSRSPVSLWSTWRRFEFYAGTAVAMAAGLILGVYLGHETWKITAGQPPTPVAHSTDLLAASGFDLLGEPHGDSLAEAFLQLTRVH